MNKNFSNNTGIPLDPDPSSWISHQDISSLKKLIDPISGLLKSAGSYENILLKWIQLAIAHEQSSIENNAASDKLLISTLCNLNALPNTDELKYFLSEWAKRQWSNKIESLFLQYKSRLEQASCRVLRHENADLIQELYHRLKSKECTFEELSFEYGFGHEKFTGGFYPLQSIEKLPSLIAERVKLMEPGQLTKPLKGGKFYFIVKLEKYQHAVFNSEAHQLLFQYQLDLWVNTAKTMLIDHLELEQQEI